MNTAKKYLLLALLIFLTSFGISFAIKAGIGLAAFDAFNQTLSDTSGLKVGSIVMFAQIFFVFLQLILLKKKTTVKIFLQIPMVILLGQFINFFVYTVFDELVFNHYLTRLIIFILSQFWISFFVGAILVLDLIAMPIEHFSLILTKRIPFTLGKIRQSIDLILIILSLMLTFIFSVSLSIREGTLISALIFGPMLGFFMTLIRSYLLEWKFIG